MCLTLQEPLQSLEKSNEDPHEDKWKISEKFYQSGPICSQRKVKWLLPKDWMPVLKWASHPKLHLHLVVCLHLDLPGP